MLKFNTYNILYVFIFHINPELSHAVSMQKIAIF